MKTLILSSGVVEKYLNVKMAVETVDFVFKEWGEERIDLPPKIHIDMSGIGHESWCNAMPAYIDQQKTGGLKWIGGFGNNPMHHLPYIMGVVLLTDPRNGYVKSIMDGRLISDFRTGASAAVFSRYLSINQLHDILIVGAGAQGQMAARCLNFEYPDAQINIYDLLPEKVENFQRQQQGTSLANAITVCTNLEQASRNARLIVLLTTAKKPFLQNNWIKPGTTVLGMGTYQQIEPSFALMCDKIIADSWEQAKGRGELKNLYETGSITDKDCHAELSSILAGKKTGREKAEERILGLPVGLGAHDVAIGNIIFEMAKASGDGVEIEIQEGQSDQQFV